MKRSTLFEECLANVAPEIKEEVNLNIDIANRISDLLKLKGMTQRKLAVKMNKRESEVSRWLTGSHGFTTSTLAKIAAVLGEPIIEVKQNKDPQYVFVSIVNPIASSCEMDASYITRGESHAKYKYRN